MHHESTLVLPVAVDVNKAVFGLASDSPAPVLPGPPPNAEEVRALEAVFAAKERESTVASGLLGLWTGTLVLHDLAVETFSETEDEVQPENKPKEKEAPEVI
jgi:hypothetical protein